MKAQELRNLSKEELVNKEAALRHDLFKQNLQRYGGRAEKPHMFKALRKDIARVKTVLSQLDKKKKA
jgi:large subunit ribosomal protein L29